MFFQRKSAEGGLPLAWECAVKGGILFSKRIPPLYPPEKDEGGPLDPDIAGLRLEELHTLRNVSAVYMASP